MAASFFSGGDYLRHRRIGAPEANIIRICIMEKINRLKNEAEIIHQRIKIIFFNIMTAEQNFACIDIPIGTVAIAANPWRQSKIKI